MKIYVASSWKNAHQPKVVEVLRSAGHEVYDFRKPRAGNEGFSWRQVDPTHKPGEPVTAEHWRRLVDHPVALEGHALDLGAMKWADACVYVLPCGRSASFEAGWFAGQGKRLVVLAFEPTEPELMFREADIVGSLSGMLDALASPSPETGATATMYAGRIQDVASENFGPFPRQTDEEAMTAIERGIFEQRLTIERLTHPPAVPAAEPVKPPATWVDIKGGWVCTQGPHYGRNVPATKALPIEDDGDMSEGGAGACVDCWKAGLREPLAHPLFPDPRTVCKPCDGTGRDTRVPANGWDVACSACNGTGRTPAAEPCPSCGGNHGPIDPAYLHPTDHRIIHPTPVDGCMYCPAIDPAAPAAETGKPATCECGPGIGACSACVSFLPAFMTDSGGSGAFREWWGRAGVDLDSNRKGIAAAAFEAAMAQSGNYTAPSLETGTAARDTEPRVPGCQCHLEVGDSPCRVHGDEGDKPPAAEPGDRYTKGKR